MEMESISYNSAQFDAAWSNNIVHSQHNHSSLGIFLKAFVWNEGMCCIVVGAGRPLRGRLFRYGVRWWIALETSGLLVEEG